MCELLPKIVNVGAWELALLSPVNKLEGLFWSLPNKLVAGFYSPKREVTIDGLPPNRDV